MILEKFLGYCEYYSTIKSFYLDSTERNLMCMMYSTVLQSNTVYYHYQGDIHFLVYYYLGDLYCRIYILDVFECSIAIKDREVFRSWKL